MSVLWNLANLPAASEGMLLIWLDAATKGIVLLGMTALLAWALRRTSAATRHLVWTLGVVALMALPFLSSSLPALHSRSVTNALAAILPAATPSSGTVTSSASSGFRAAGSAESRLAVANRSALFSGLRAEDTIPASPAVPTLEQLSSSDPFALQLQKQAAPQQVVTVGHTATNPATTWLAWILPIWIVGAVCTAGWFTLQYGSMRWLTRGATRASYGSGTRCVERLSAEIGLHGHINVLEGDDQIMPMTWGLFRPVVLLPRNAESWPEARRRNVLMHELAHIKRRDHLTQLLSQIACTLHWFNPIAWYAAHRMCVEREHACDDYVLNMGTRASDYAESLLEIVHSLRRRPANSMAAIAMAGRSSLRERLTAILDAGRKRGALEARATLPAVLVGLAIVIPLASLDLTPTSAAFAAEPRSVVSQLAPEDILLLTEDEVARLRNEDLRSFTKERIEALEHRLEDLRREARDRGVLAFDALELDEFKLELFKLDEYDQGAFTLEPLDLDAFKVEPHDLDVLNLDELDLEPFEFNIFEAARVPRADDDDESVLILDSDYPILALNNLGIQVNRINGTWNINLRDGDTRLRIKSRGEIEFNEEGTDVVAISRRGYLDIEEKSEDGDFRVRLRGKRGGEISRDWWVDGDKQPYDEDAARWLAEALPELSRNTGLNAGPRVQRILDEEGVDGVLDEIEEIGSDHVQRIYFTELQERADLDDKQVARAFETAGRRIASDFELASLLVSVAKDTLNEAARLAYADASRSIGSDFEHSRALAALVTNHQLNRGAMEAVLSAATAIGSDFELAQLLLKVVEHQDLENNARSFFKALATVGSDFEQRRVLMALSQRDPLSPEMIGRMFEVASQEMGSDFELASFVVEIAKHHPIEGESVRDCIRALDTVGSDYEYRRAASALVKSVRLDEEAVSDLLRSAGRNIGSDYELAELLLQVVDSYELRGELREAYLDATESIGSNHENQRVLAALARTEK